MGRRLFARSLAFAAVVALAAVSWQLVTRRVLGTNDAATLFALVTPAFYVAAIAPSWRRGMVALAVAVPLLGLALAAGLTVGSPGVSLVAAMVALAWLRSGLLFRRRRARALVLEVALLAAGGFFAFHWMDGPWLGPGIALWVFYLVQSLYFVFAESEQPDTASPRGDAFDQARRRVEALL